MSSRILSVVVPVYNIADHVDHLAAELSKLAHVDVQVVIVDDGSTDGTGAALSALNLPVDDLVLLAASENAGAGAARNLGFPQATGTYTLFFDGDDVLHVDEILETVERLEATGADASINRYEFIRDGQSAGTGMNVIDRVLWKDYLGRFPDDVFALPEAPRFLEFTNYPWNKIIRTARYQNLALVPFFGKTRVHNDILGHWNILLHARRIALVNRTIVTHHVSGARDHLSNRFGMERLDLFVALRSVHDILRGDPAMTERYGPVFWSFAKRLMIWAQAKLQDDVVAAFDRQARALITEASFEELLGLTQSGDAGTYRWLLDRIG